MAVIGAQLTPSKQANKRELNGMDKNEMYSRQRAGGGSLSWPQSKPAATLFSCLVQVEIHYDLGGQQISNSVSGRRDRVRLLRARVTPVPNTEHTVLNVITEDWPELTWDSGMSMSKRRAAPSTWLSPRPRSQILC